MAISSEEIKDILAAKLTDYINTHHSQEECIGFIDGFKSACDIILDENDSNKAADLPIDNITSANKVMSYFKKIWK